MWIFFEVEWIVIIFILKKYYDMEVYVLYKIWFYVCIWCVVLGVFFVGMFGYIGRNGVFVRLGECFGVV